MENLIYNLVSDHNADRFSISVACLVESGHLTEMMRDRGADAFMVPPMVPAASMIYPRHLVKLIRGRMCDVVHTHSGCWSKVAIACFMAGGVPLVYTEHGRPHPDPWSNRVLDRIAVRWTDRVVAVGDSLNRYLVEQVGLPSEKVMTIYNGIDTVRFQPLNERAQVRAELGYGDENVVIGIVARLAPVKNHQYLLRAFGKARASCEHARLLIIGGGNLRSEHEGLAHELELAEYVRFLGDREDVPRLLNACDLATLSSLSEGISLTILEAMSTGLPVVATDVGGNGAIVSNGRNGYLVPLEDDEVYADRLRQLIRDGQKRQALGNQARQDVISNWSHTRMVSEYEQLYEGLTARRWDGA
jgi:sugar transferase (PEP-CTERM/EpsH1 system associated)